MLVFGGVWGYVVQWFNMFLAALQNEHHFHDRKVMILDEPGHSSFLTPLEQPPIGMLFVQWGTKNVEHLFFEYAVLLKNRQLRLVLAKLFSKKCGESPSFTSKKEQRKHIDPPRSYLTGSQARYEKRWPEVFLGRKQKTKPNHHFFVSCRSALSRSFAFSK